MRLRFPYRLIFALFIVGFSLGVRFYHFQDQWDLFGDAGRDQIVGWGAYLRHDLPLVGSFSSSGPFVFGPLYYWFITGSYWVFPKIAASPQMWFRLLMLLPIVFIWQAGYVLGKSRLAMIAALLTATSPRVVGRSISMSHHSLIAVTSSLLVWLFVLYLQTFYAKKASVKKRRLYLALAMGVTMGIGVNIHYQMLNLWPIFAVMVILNRHKLRAFWQEAVLIFFGFLLPNIPFIYWDATTQAWANTRNFLDYILIVQERLYVPNRWLTYILQFWPDLWSRVVGGFGIFGYVFLTLIGAVFLLQTIRKKLSPPLIWLSIIAMVMVVILRYYRGEIFFGYFIFFQPFIFIFSAWLINQLLTVKKAVGVALLTMTLVANTYQSVVVLQGDIKTKLNQQVTRTALSLASRFPGEQLTPYVYGDSPEDKSYGLVIMLASEHKISESGRPIGICKNACPDNYVYLDRVILIQDELRFVDLTGVDITSVNRQNGQRKPPSPKWSKFTILAIDNNITNWWRKQPLNSTFSLKNYLLGRLRII